MRVYSGRDSKDGDCSGLVNSDSAHEDIGREAESDRVENCVWHECVVLLLCWTVSLLSNLNACAAETRCTIYAVIKGLELMSFAAQ